MLGAFSYEIARPRPDAEDRRAGRSTSGQPARRQRRGDRDADHQARSRRRSTPSAASTSCAPAPTRATRSVHHHLHARARHRVGDAGRPRQGRDDRRPVPARHRAAADQQDRSRRRADSHASSSSVRARRRRSPRSPTSRSSRSSRRCKDVGSVSFIGDRKREIQLLLNADRLNAYGLTVDQVAHRGRRGRTSRFPAAASSPGPSEVALRTMGRIKNVDDFNRIVIVLPRDGSVDHVRRRRRASRTPTQEVRSATRLDGDAGDRRCRSASSRAPTPSRSSIACWRGSQQIQATLPPDIKISIGTRPVALHPHVVRGHPAAPDPRRPARQRRRVPVHPQPARHVHRRAGDPDLDHRHVHAHEDRSASR